MYYPYFATLNFSECLNDLDCPDHLACGEDEVCVDPPCPDCGANAYCEGINHIGICNCNLGYFGDSYDSCKGKKQAISSFFIATQN